MHDTPINILLVDDDEDDYVLVRDLVSQINEKTYRLEWAATYESALEQIRRDRHDLYLIDYRLGGPTGLDLLRTAIAQGVKAPVIMLTGQGDHEVDVEAMKAGAADYLVKEQIEPSLLERSIRYALERTRARESLERSERKYRTLFEESKDAVFIVSSQGKLDDINPAGVKLFGYTTKEELLNIDLRRDLYSDPADHDKLTEIIAQQGFVKDHELTLRTKDGRGVIVLVTASAVREDPERELTYRGIMRDITGQKQLEEELLHAQKMESLGTLAGGIAHDFNNLLCGILGHVSLMKMKVQPDHQLFGNLDVIERSASRAAELTTQLLAFARRGKCNIQAIDINDVVNDTLRIVRRTFDKSIEVETGLRESLPTIEADAGQLGQVFMNLCVNARDAMPQGGKLYVETDTTVLTEDYTKTHVDAKPGVYVVLTITDTGTGMNRETVARIFDPFFTTKEVGKGTGLGLSMVYGIVKNHGALVYAYSEPGRGTTFKIYLPVSGKPRLQETPQNQPQSGNKELILVVDDEEAVRSLVKETLQRYSYRVLLAEDGEQGIELYKKHMEEIGLVLLDMSMPKMGGRETFLKMKEMNGNMRALLSTGYSRDERAREILDGGALDFIQKPYHIQELLSKVRRALDAE